MQPDLHLPPELELRPRFKRQLKLSPEEVTLRLKDGLKKIDCPVRGRVIPGHTTIELPEKDQVLWSPRLSLSWETNPDGQGSLLRGFYGPAPGVWTFFMFLYVSIVFSVFVVLVWGLVQKTLGEDAPILWLVPLFIAAFLTLWLVARSGQKLSRPQMNILQDFVEECVGDKVG